MVQVVYRVIHPQKLYEAFEELLLCGQVEDEGQGLDEQALEVLAHLDLLALHRGRTVGLEEVGIEVVECLTGVEGWVMA